MADLAAEIIRLSLYETRAIVSLRTLAPGVYTQRMLTQGNSLLSTVFVESVGAGGTVSVRYYDYTTGADLGEQFTLATHPTLSAALSFNRMTIPRLHDKPVVEITVANDSVRLGIYVTVVASFVSDLDQSLQLDGTVADLLSDKGMPAMLYDEDQGKFFFLRGEGGVIPITISEAGDSVHLTAATISTPGTLQELISDPVPVGKTRKLTQAIVTCRQQGAYTITAGPDIIGSGRIGPSNLKDIFTWNPRISRPAGTVIKINFTAAATAPASDVEAYLMGSDV